jgi:hypothetical protein
MKYLPSKFTALLLTLIVGMFASSTAFGAATIVIQNNDAAGVGFNDPTPATPVGNNPGTTVGEQRLKAFEFAAGIWGATLTSGPVITIRAGWSTTMTCTTNSAVLGSAGAASNFRDFPGAPFPGTWYGSALANALSGSDLSPNPEINATFNANIGTAGCLDSAHWYYGFDNAHGNAGIDLVTVLLHEFGHGLGFQTLTSSSTGTQSQGFPSIYDRFLFDNASGKTWVQMTDAERAASAISLNKLAWQGPQVAIDTPSVLTGGMDASGRPLMYTPNPVETGASVSHWDKSETPNQLMEPNISGLLTHSVTPPQDLTFSVMRDLGWCAGCPQPTPAPTPTPTPPAAANDNFAAAQTISGCSGSVTGHNFAATHEPGEPLHSPDSDPGGGSVWYQWQAPSTGSVTITTAGSNYDTVLAVYAGGSVGGLTLIANNDDVDPGVITTSTVTFNATAGTVYRIAVDGWGNARGNIVLNWNESCSVAPPTVQFAASGYSVGEAGGFVDVTVTRSSSVGASTVDFNTNDLLGVPATDLQPANCSAVNGSASGKCDYVTAGGTLRFADTESSKVIRLSIVDDTFVEGNETLTIGLSNPTGATVGSQSSTTITILDNDSDPNASNPYLNNPFFVRQQYLDFLLREPDTAGYNSWLATLNGCGPQQGGLGSPANCDRVEVSSAFFRSTEFNEKGYWVYRFYEGSLGRKPLFAEFTSEMRQLSGLMSDAEQESRRGLFIARFMQRSEFTNIYSSLTNPASAAQFIATLEQKARVTLPASTTTLPGQPPQYGRQQLIDLMAAGTFTPAQTLRAFIEQSVVWNKHFFPAFVAMQYYGYLRRDPDDAGYNDWVRVLTFGDAPSGTPPSDYRHLIFGFVYSVEYRSRFGKP